MEQHRLNQRTAALFLVPHQRHQLQQQQRRPLSNLNGIIPYQSYRDIRGFVSFLANEVINNFIERKLPTKEAIKELPSYLDETGADMISTFIRNKFEGISFLDVCLMLGNKFKISKHEKSQMFLIIENYLESLLTTTFRHKRGLFKMAKKRFFKRQSIECVMIDEFREFRTSTPTIINVAENDENQSGGGDGMKLVDNDYDGIIIEKECKAFKKVLKNSINLNIPFVYKFSLGFNILNNLETIVLEKGKKQIIHEKLSKWLEISEEEYVLINLGKMDLIAAKQEYIVECEKILIIIISRFIFASIKPSKMLPTIFKSKYYAECLIFAIPSLFRNKPDELIELIGNDFQLKRKLTEELDDIKRIYDLKLIFP